MEKIRISTVFVIPFYDKDISQLEDTIESIFYYIKEPFVVVCVNDCRDSSISNFPWEKAENVIIYKPKKTSGWPRNTYGSMFCKKYEAMEYANSNFVFDFFICMDTDALITGKNLLKDIYSRLKQSERDIGILGSYRIRADDQKRTRWQWACYMLYLVYIKKAIPRKSFFWHSVIAEAKKNGYRLGESMLGGAFMLSKECFDSMRALFPYEKIVENDLFDVELGEDVIFSIFAYASGYRIGDFGASDDPLAIAQNFLPIPKEKVISQGKQLIHSVKRGLEGESESELRSFFRSYRK